MMIHGKCHLFVIGHKSEQIWAKIGPAFIRESNSAKFVGVAIDKKPRFYNHISPLCATANRKLSANARVTY